MNHEQEIIRTECRSLSDKQLLESAHHYHTLGGGYVEQAKRMLYILELRNKHGENK
jgi:hypothetical protein